MNSNEDNPPLLIDLHELHDAASRGGPQWGGQSHDLNLTLLSWPCGEGVAPHVNDALDVVFVVVSGEGEVTVDDQVFLLTVGRALLIPQGARRGVRAVSERFSYLSIHRRRGGLMPVSNLRFSPVVRDQPDAA